MAELDLDHVGVAGRALEPLLGAWRTAGFAPTDPRPLLGRDPVSGAQLDLGQASAHLVFDGSYVELTEVPDASTGNHLEPWLQQGGGLRIIAFGARDIAVIHRRVSGVLAGVSKINTATRQIEYGSRHGQARFEWFMLPAEVTPEALVCFVQNHTPELVFQREVMSHSNGCRELLGVEISCEHPEALAARYSDWTGQSWQPSSNGIRLTLDQGWVDFVKMQSPSEDGLPRATGIVLEAPGPSCRMSVGPPDCRVDLRFISGAAA